MQLQHTVVPEFSRDFRLQSGTLLNEHSICTAILCGGSHVSVTSMVVKIALNDTRLI